MQLSELIQEETILLALQADSRNSCIQAMTESLVQSGSVSDAVLFMESVFNREKTGSTGIGFGVAIPHGKSAGVQSPAVAFAQFATPVDWKSLDDQPVQIAFLIAVPETSAGQDHLKILATLSRKLIHAEFRQKLICAKSATEVLEILASV